jgi:hypothetical protein
MVDRVVRVEPNREAEMLGRVAWMLDRVEPSREAEMVGRVAWMLDRVEPNREAETVERVARTSVAVVVAALTRARVSSRTRRRTP